jgi:hypothetical protein
MYRETFEWHSLAAHLCKLEDTCKHATKTHFRDFITIEVAKHISGALSDIEVTIVTVFMVANFKVRQ